MDFLFGLRMLIAGDVGADDVMEPIIDEAIMKPIEARINLLKDDNSDSSLAEATRLQKNLDGIRDLFSSNWFDKKVEIAARSLYRTNKTVILDEDDFVVAALMQIAKAGLAAWSEKKFDPMQTTAENIQKNFSVIANNAMRRVIRKEQSVKRKEVSIHREDDKDVSSMIIDENAPVPFVKEYIKDIQKALGAAVERAFGKKSLGYAVWLAWWKGLRRSTGERVFLTNIANDKIIRSFYEGEEGNDADEKRFIRRLYKIYTELRNIVEVYFKKQGVYINRDRELEERLNFASDGSERIADIRKMEGLKRIITAFIFRGMDIGDDGKTPEEMVEVLRVERAKDNRRAMDDDEIASELVKIARDLIEE